MAKILRLPATCERTGQSKSAIHDGVKDGTFPKPLPLGRRTVGWLEDEIEEWIEGRKALRDAGQVKRPAGPGRGHRGSMRPSAV
jgi:prophage regulatory protein